MTSHSNASFRVQGLSAPLTISLDQWGIPHIQAQTINDAFFGQGYAAALLRLWQLDLNHRRQIGALAEVFGADFVPFDHVARLLAFRGPLEPEWKKLDPRVEGVAKAFTAGVNARIEQVLQDPALLPIEFKALGMQPARWHVDDLLRARVSASPNVQGEARRAKASSRIAAASTAASSTSSSSPAAKPDAIENVADERKSSSVSATVRFGKSATGAPPAAKWNCAAGGAGGGAPA